VSTLILTFEFASIIMLLLPFRIEAVLDDPVPITVNVPPNGFVSAIPSGPDAMIEPIRSIELPDIYTSFQRSGRLPKL